MARGAGGGGGGVGLWVEGGLGLWGEGGLGLWVGGGEGGLGLWGGEGGLGLWGGEGRGDHLQTTRMKMRKDHGNYCNMIDYENQSNKDDRTTCKKRV